MTSKGQQFVHIFGLVPGNVERYSGRRTYEPVKRGAVFEFLVNIPRLTRSREARKTRPARSQSPRWERYSERWRFGDEGFDIDRPAQERPATGLGRLMDPLFKGRVVGGDASAGALIVS